ncbi:MAG TPA: NYN domain-containing protein [Candidatus Agrococcus pullicola]|uniref:NYN domain-containing protein n=1 Tax=Candidatus Agrococcus pullicola TaxID=2838429 RepID=A0A9D1Z005_9MICO|nr:NYN domain-containing protein [Candidatus Agrococcus pullicola]
MRSQSALLVDAGYLLAAAATRLTGSSFRRSVNANYEKLVAELIELVEQRSGLPILRVYWYDAGRSGIPDLDQERVAALPKVKLRLGRVGVEGEQKGVDLRIGLDMVSHSRKGSVDTIYLLSGDDDLTEAVEEAQAQGVQVVVLAVPTPTGAAHGVSKFLVRAADGVEVLESRVLDSTISAAVTSLVPHPAKPGTESAVTKATPGDLARRSPSTRPIPMPLAYSSGGSSSPYVAPEIQRDPEETTATIRTVVRKAYDAWLRSATEEQRQELLTRRPTIPSELDRALLVDLSEALGDYYLGDGMRVELRSKFWEAVEAAEKEDGA